MLISFWIVSYFSDQNICTFSGVAPIAMTAITGFALTGVSASDDSGNYTQILTQLESSTFDFILHSPLLSLQLHPFMFQDKPMDPHTI